MAFNEDLEKKLKDIKADSERDAKKKHKKEREKHKGEEKIMNKVEGQLEDTLAEFGLKVEEEESPRQAEEETVREKDVKGGKKQKEKKEK